MTLVDARLQLHWAAQIAAGVGRTLAPQRADDSHTAFAFEDGALLQEPVGGLRAGLELDALALVCGEERFALRGQTLDDGFAFLEARFGHALRRPDVALPEHPVGHGAVFDADLADCAALAARYTDAAALLPQLGGGPVRCWPHHFDLATLLDAGTGAANGRTIGVGLSPGDASFSEPYWYVTPYPYPDAAALPPLTRGRWHTQRWIGAVLPAATGDEAQAFLEAAIAACRRLLA
jgi:hypothetical protein